MEPIIVGIAGSVCVLVAFVLNVMKRVTAQDKSYLLINSAGSILLIWYAILLGWAWPFIALNIVWLCIAAWGMLRG